MQCVQYAQADAQIQVLADSLDKHTTSGNGIGTATHQLSIAQMATAAQRMCLSRGESQIASTSPTAKSVDSSTQCAWFSLRWRENIGGSYPQHNWQLSTTLQQHS
jgi:hypothetical protein